ncbi:GumC family protein [Pantanalinema sp. GBBB05]|uniref:GumC family protein n=1 Tax=Pantanalinema sp. GBBB05 TaxID=2604139 RepID=UPI001DA6A381|nr:polysaccharide biosynthesis tyrosine autokinase [Pantanalinema sp. GBBB05]
MDRQPDSLPIFAELNGKSPYSLDPTTASREAEEEKWDLGWLVAVIRRRALLMAIVAVGTTTLAGGGLMLLTESTPSQYAGKFQLLVEPITAEEQLARSSTRAQGAYEPDAQRINIDQSSLDYESQIRILQGPKLLEPVVKQVRQRYPDITYETLTQNLKIARITTLTSDKREQGTKLINVSYQDSDPEKIKFILDRLSQTYLKYSLKERQSTIRRGIQFIDSQLPPLRQRVDLLQRQIQALRQQYTIVDPEQQGQQLTAAIGRLDQVEADNQTLMAETVAKRNTLARQLQNASPQSVLGETPYYQALLSQYQEVEAQIAADSTRFQPNSPAMQALLEKRQNLQNLLNQEASRVVSKANDSIAIANARRQAINQAQAEMNQRMQQLPAIARQYTDLQRELILATESLNKFATRQEALQIDAAQQEIPWELTIPPRLEVDEFGQPVPINSLSKIRFLALIAVLAVLLGVGAGFLVEITQDMLHTPDEVKRATHLPLLGVIPHNHSSSRAISIPVTEAFRSLSKNLRLLKQTHAPLRSITIASPEPGNGKSTIALYLAMTTAAMGQRVLLVDADLRRPQLHKRLQLPNQQGLSNLLLGEQDVNSVTQSLRFCENLTVLTSGRPPIDPVEMFTPDRVEQVFHKLHSMFDLVIVDTPPLLGLADSGLVAAQCDSLALVVRLGKTSRSSVLAALEELKFLATPVLGVIANDAPETSTQAQSYYSLVQPS